MKLKHVLIFALVGLLAILSGMPVLSSGITTVNYLDARPNSNSQAQGSVNVCGNGELPDNVGCQHIASQVRGDENAESLTSNQRFTERAREGVGVEAFLRVLTHVSCDPGIDCPNPDDFEYGIIPEETVSVEPQTFKGSDTGTVIEFTNFGESTIDFIMLITFPTTPEMSTMLIPREGRCDTGATITHVMLDLFEGSIQPQDTSSIPRCEIDFHFRAD